MDWLICAETSVSMKCLPSPTLLMLSFIWEWSEIILFIYEIYTKLHFYKRSKSNWLSLSLCLHSHIINIVTTFYLITLLFFRIYSSIYQFKNESTVRLCVYENLWYFFCLPLSIFQIINDRLFFRVHLFKIFTWIFTIIIIIYTTNDCKLFFLITF